MARPVCQTLSPLFLNFLESRRRQTHHQLKPLHDYPRFNRDANTMPQWTADAAVSQTEWNQACTYVWETPRLHGLLSAKLCPAVVPQSPLTQVPQTKLWTLGINPLLEITDLSWAAFSEISNILHMESKCVPDVRGLCCWCCLHPGSALCHQNWLLFYLHLDMFIFVLLFFVIFFWQFVYREAGIIILVYWPSIGREECRTALKSAAESWVFFYV